MKPANLKAISRLGDQLRLRLPWAVGASLILWSCACLPGAEVQPASEVEDLKKQLQQLREQFERTQREQQQQIETLTKKLEDLTRQQAAEAEKKKLEQELSAELQSKTPQPPAAGAAAAPASSWSPASPIQIQSGRSYMDIGMVGTFAVGSSTGKDIEGGLELGGHDPNQRGFTVQGLEANFLGAVDPYFRGNANVVFQVDSEGGSNVELEEAWLETMSLPASLQLRAGQILTEFGRQNPTHPHSWAFVDVPLVLGRFLGPDGLRNPGARLSWLAPTPFYSELFFSVQNSQGDTAAGFRSSNPVGKSGLPLGYRLAENDRGVQGIEDMLFTPRYAASFDVTDSQVILVGASAALGPNASGDDHAGATRTEIYGLDFTWKWKSPRQHGGFPFVAFQTEALLRRYDAGAFDWDLNGNGQADPGEVLDPATGAPARLRSETLQDYGFYTQLLYGFKKGWVAGMRLDMLGSDTAHYEEQGLVYNGQRLGRDSTRASRWRLSPNLTWYPSEYSKLRLQYNYDDREQFGQDHSIWFQFEFLLGAHAAHKF